MAQVLTADHAGFFELTTRGISINCLGRVIHDGNAIIKQRRKDNAASLVVDMLIASPHLGDPVTEESPSLVSENSSNGSSVVHCAMRVLCKLRCLTNNCMGVSVIFLLVDIGLTDVHC